MKDFLKELRSAGNTMTILSVGMIVLGILLIVFTETLLRVVCYVAGAVAVVFGVWKLIGYFKRYKNNFVFTAELGTGIAALVIGLLLLICPISLLSLFPAIMGLLLIVDGAFKIQSVIVTSGTKDTAWVIELVFAILTCVVGLCLLINPFSGIRVMMIILGVWLIVNGIGNLCAVFGVRRLHK